MKAIIIAFTLLMLIACNPKKQATNSHNMAGMAADTPKSNNRTADMSGMNMDMPEDSAAQTSDEVKLTNQQVQLGNIHVDTIRSVMNGDKMILTAVLTEDETKASVITARVMGRVDRLYFKIPGGHVNKGDKLFELYSEDMNNAKQELVLAIAQKQSLGNAAVNIDRLIQSAENKLLLWGMSRQQLDTLEIMHQSTPLTTVYSPAEGTITAVNVKEGDYAMEGATIMKLADYSTVWAEAQVYSYELYQVDTDGTAEVRFPDLPGKKVTGHIAFVNPELSAGSGLNLIRVNVPNSSRTLQPGMPAYVTVENRKHTMLSLPVDAVLRSGGAAFVWVQTAPGVFKNKMVATGMENGDRVEITEGLASGDIVVISGAYLINSEYIFQKGANPMAGMKM